MGRSRTKEARMSRMRKVLTTTTIVAAMLGVTGAAVVEPARADSMQNAWMSCGYAGTGRVSFGLPSYAPGRYSLFAYRVNYGAWRYKGWYYSEYGGIWDLDANGFRAHFGVPDERVGNGFVEAYEYRWYSEGSPYNGWVFLNSCQASDF
jgi:hypothetical protein